MRNRFLVAVVFGVVITLWSRIGRDVLGFTVAAPFGLRDDVFQLALSLPVARQRPAAADRLPAWWLYGERLSARSGVALAVGLGGLLVVALPTCGGSGARLSLLSAAAVTAGTLMVRYLGDVDVVVARSVSPP
jgi:P-type Cu2+ transporter